MHEEGKASAAAGSGSRDVVAAATAAAGSGSRDVVVARLGAAEAALEALACVEVEDLAPDQLETLLGQLPRLLRQLDGVRARVFAAAQRAALRQRSSEDAGVVLNDHQRQLSRQQRLAPTQAKRLLDAGRAAADHRATGAAMRAGDLDAGQAQTIARILAEVPLDRRAAVEAELLELARQHDPVTFGRHARAILGREQSPALARDERRQHARRSFRAADTDDGGLAVSGAFYGVAAERVRLAVRAFRRPDTPNEHRTPGQRGADAFEQLCEAALRSGAAPTSHGVRPQVIVTMSAADLAALEDAPTDVTGTLVGSGQTVSGAELRSLVADSQLVRLVLDADRTPIEVSGVVRTVPLGLWRALLIRDGGCVWPGCDAPASWCDVAHGADAYADDGKLSPANAMLLCRRHHRTFDAGDRAVRIDGDSVTFPGVRLPGAGPRSAALERDAVTIPLPVRTEQPAHHPLEPHPPPVVSSGPPAAAGLAGTGRGQPRDAIEARTSRGSHADRSRSGADARLPEEQQRPRSGPNPPYGNPRERLRQDPEGRSVPPESESPDAGRPDDTVASPSIGEGHVPPRAPPGRPVA
ncbi:MAG: DUF222 domain-containing protein [Nitriliruptoraceae bacterium]